MSTSTLVHTSTSTMSATTEGLDIPAPLRTRDGDLSPMRAGTKSDLSWGTKGRVMPVEVKRAPMCPAGHPVTSRAHKACS